MAKRNKIEIEMTIDGKQANLAIKNSDKLVKQLSKSAQTTGTKLSNLGNIATGLNSAMMIGQRFMGTISKTIDLYKVQEQAEASLTAALGYKSQALLDDAAALQKVTTHGDEEIIQAQALIGMFVKDEDQIKKVTAATLDLADAKGMSLKSAADLMSKTLGSSTNAMSRYGIEVHGAVGSTERLDSLLGSVNEKFGGQATAKAATDTGKLTQAQNELGDAMERVGGVMSDILVRITPALSWIAENFSGGMDIIFGKEKEIAGALERQKAYTESLKGTTEEWRQSELDILSAKWDQVDALIQSGELTDEQLNQQKILLQTIEMQANALSTYKDKQDEVITNQNKIESLPKSLDVADAQLAGLKKISAAEGLIYEGIYKKAKEITLKKIKLAKDETDAHKEKSDVELSGVTASYNANKSLTENVSNAVTSRIKSYVAEAVVGYVSSIVASTGPFALIAAPAAYVAAEALMNSIIPSYRYGTMDHSGGMALVGEEGPELVNLPAHSQVITAVETRQIINNAGGGANMEGFAMLAAEIRAQTARLEAVERRISFSEFDEGYQNYIDQKNYTGG